MTHIIIISPGQHAAQVLSPEQSDQLMSAIQQVLGDSLEDTDASSDSSKAE